MRNILVGNIGWRSQKFVVEWTIKLVSLLRPCSFDFIFFQGTDITEAFESHHISSEPEEILERYFVGDSKEQRNYFFTYDENGFYRTLKKRVADKLKSIDRSITWKSKFIHDINLLALFVATIIMSRSDDQIKFVISTLLAAQFLAWSANFSHNFAHQADNWRMYTANISLITWRDFRVFHVLVSFFMNHSFFDLL